MSKDILNREKQKLSDYSVFSEYSKILDEFLKDSQKQLPKKQENIHGTQTTQNR
jgi:hypothetical protein